MSERISVTDRDGARWVTIRNERKSNALLPEDCRSIESAVATVPATVKAIVFRGGGERAFCAGMDVTGFLALDASSARSFVEPLKDMLNQVRLAPLATIAAINGGCIGGGVELAAACDLRVASSHAVFGMPEIKVGIPSALDAALLQQYVGLSFAKEMMLLGDLHNAERMHHEGFLNRVVPLAELDSTVQELVRKVQPFTRTVMAAQKRMFEAWQNQGIRDANETSVDVWAAVFTESETMQSIEQYKEQLSKRAKR